MRRPSLSDIVRGAVLAVLLAAGGAAAASLSVPARHAGALDLATGEWLFTKAADEAVPVASITKVVAALTFLDLHPDLEQLVTIQRDDWVHAGRTRLRIGDRVRARTLLKLALVASDNCAARALAHPFGDTPEVFGFRMQQTAVRLGCRKSRFVEPSGLDPGNVSTVREVGILFAEALRNPLLRSFLGTNEFTLHTPREDRVMVHSSRLLRSRADVLAAKTGYIDAAGYCLVQCTHDEGGDFITVVLGAGSRDRRNRASERMMDFVRKTRRARGSSALR